MSIVSKGFRVVEPGKPRENAKDKRPTADVQLSRVFTVRSAAQAFLDIARSNGHPAAYIVDVMIEDGLKDRTT